MAATVAPRLNPDLRAFFERLRENGMPWKMAIIAVARKLAVLANAVLKRGNPWRDQSHHKDGCYSGVGASGKPGAVQSPAR